MIKITTKKKGGRLLILTYHYVRETGGQFPGIHPTSENELSSQLDKLKNKYHKATLGEASDFILGKKPLERDSFLITFDDGLLDHYEFAQKVLTKHNIKAVFFIPTKPLIESMSPAVHKIHWLRANIQPDKFEVLLNRFLPDRWSNMELSEQDKARSKAMHIHDNQKTQELKFFLNFVVPYDVIDKVLSRMINELGMTESRFCQATFMNKKQIQALASDGHLIGMHGHTHVPFSSFKNSQLEEDVSINQACLSEFLGEIPRWLSYPYGRDDAIPKDPSSLCRLYNIDAAFTLISGMNYFGDEASMLKRITPSELSRFI